jgi:hypothetical protein
LQLHPSNFSRNTCRRTALTLIPHSSYLDFPALYNQACSTPGTYLCSDRYFCDVGISNSLVQAYPDVFGPLKGVKASSICAWNPFPVYQAPQPIACPGGSSVYYVNVPNDCLPHGSYHVTPKGACTLAGPANPRYTGAKCPTAAAGTGVLGHTVYSTTGVCNDSNCGKVVNAGDKPPCSCGNCGTCENGVGYTLNFNAQSRNINNDGTAASKVSLPLHVLEVCL